MLCCAEEQPRHRTGNGAQWFTWTYEELPYIVSGIELYDDLVVAYHNEAKYAVVFDHPDTDYSNYEILTN